MAENENKGINMTNVKTTTVWEYISLALIVILIGVVIYLALKNNSYKDDILDAREQVSELRNYQDSVKRMGDTFVNEVLRVSGPERILRIIEMQNPEFKGVFDSLFSINKPISYQYIKIRETETIIEYQPVVYRQGDSIIIPINKKEGLISVDGMVIAFVDTNKNALVSMKIKKDPVNLVVSITEDDDNNLFANVTSNDPSIVVEKLDTRILNRYEMREPYAFLLTGSIFAKDAKNMGVNLGAGIQIYDYSVLLSGNILKLFTENLTLQVVKRF